MVSVPGLCRRVNMGIGFHPDQWPGSPDDRRGVHRQTDRAAAAALAPFVGSIIYYQLVSLCLAAGVPPRPEARHRPVRAADAALPSLPSVGSRGSALLTRRSPSRIVSPISDDCLLMTSRSRSQSRRGHGCGRSAASASAICCALARRRHLSRWQLAWCRLTCRLLGGTARPLGGGIGAKA